MEKLLNDVLLPYLNSKRPGNVDAYEGVVNVHTEDVNGSDSFDVVDTRFMDLPVVRQFGEGHASYLNDEHKYSLRIVMYEDFLNELGDVAKGIRRPDLFVYTTGSDSYFIIHELSVGSSSNKRKDGKHQLGNTVQLLNRIPQIKSFLSKFEHKLCILSGAEGAVSSPNGIANGFSEIYSLIPNPEPLNCHYCQGGGFDAFITHNVVLR